MHHSQRITSQTTVGEFRNTLMLFIFQFKNAWPFGGFHTQLEFPKSFSLHDIFSSESLGSRVPIFPTRSFRFKIPPWILKRKNHVSMQATKKPGGWFAKNPRWMKTIPCMKILHQGQQGWWVSKRETCRNKVPKVPSALTNKREKHKNLHKTQLVSFPHRCQNLEFRISKLTRFQKHWRVTTWENHLSKSLWETSHSPTHSSTLKHFCFQNPDMQGRLMLPIFMTCNGKQTSKTIVLSSYSSIKTWANGFTISLTASPSHHLCILLDVFFGQSGQRKMPCIFQTIQQKDVLWHQNSWTAFGRSTGITVDQLRKPFGKIAGLFRDFLVTILRMESSERNIAIWRKLLHQPLFCLEVTSIFMGGLKPPNKLNEWTLLGSKCILVSFIAVLDIYIYTFSASLSHNASGFGWCD